MISLRYACEHRDRSAPSAIIVAGIYRAVRRCAISYFSQPETCFGDHRRAGFRAMRHRSSTWRGRRWCRRYALSPTSPSARIMVLH